jgi:hypothetical protein
MDEPQGTPSSPYLTCRLANMGIRYLAPSKPHGQELLAHIKLTTSFLAIYIGLLTQFSVPLDLRGQYHPGVSPELGGLDLLDRRTRLYRE